MKKLLLLIALFFTGLGLKAQCAYQLELVDQYADGWQGATIDVQVNSVNVVSYSTQDGFGASFIIPLPGLNSGDVIDIIYDDTNEEWTGEPGWILTDSSGTVVASSGPGNITGTNAASGGPFFACPACAPPANAPVSGLSSTGATLNWTSTETAFDVEWGLSGFVPAGLPSAGYDDVASGVGLTGLTSSTTYDYYLRTDCAAGGGAGQSPWVGPFSFATLPACGDNLSGLCYSLTSTQEVLVSFEVATSGDWATLTFNAGGVETCCDEVVIYDGLNGTGNIIYGALTGGGLADYSGEGTITSTTGQLSLVVNSDGSVTCNSNGTYTSFDVTVNCFTPPCFEDTIPVDACDSIMLAGAMQTVSGLYTDSLTSVTGCDSIVTFDLIINSTAFETVDVTDCDSIEVLGTWYFASTSFNDTIVGGAANGCDSITTFNLTLNSSSVGSVDTTICDDESLTLPDGAVVTAAGTYTSVVVGANGCDSVVTTELSVIMCTTGVEGIEGIETLSIYPNPYISTINLLFDDAVAGELNITLFDVTGRVLKAESVMTAIGANTISINVSPEVAAGVHILQIERDGAVYSTSIIKK